MAQYLLTATLAVSGCEGSVSHLAKPSLLAGASSDSLGRIEGTPGLITAFSPSFIGWSYCPRLRI